MLTFCQKKSAQVNNLPKLKPNTIQKGKENKENATKSLLTQV